MSDVANGDAGEGTGLQLTLRIWHPDDWTLEITNEHPGGILAHAVYSAPGETVQGLFTMYGDSSAEVENLVEATRQSRLTESVMELRERYGQRGSHNTPGNTSRELFVSYNTDHSISGALVERGFIHEEPIRIHDGWEYWPVFFPGDRSVMEANLEELRELMDADITVTRITSAGGGGTSRTEDVRRVDRLSEGQREAFELARRRGYYEWPRNVSTRELADEMDVSKTTLLEHLRKAESKLLDP